MSKDFCAGEQLQVPRFEISERVERITVDETLERLAELLAPTAASGGLRRSEVQNGLHEIVFEDHRLRMRLSWQPACGLGSSALMLECDRLPGESRTSPWIDLTGADWRPEKDTKKWITGIADDFRAAMVDYLEQWD